MKTLEVKCGGVTIGGGHPVVVQTMCNTHTDDVEATFRQCIRMAEAGAEIIRITVPGPREVEPIAEVRRRLRSEGIDTPIVADIHFSSATAIAVAVSMFRKNTRIINIERAAGGRPRLNVTKFFDALENFV